MEIEAKNHWDEIYSSKNSNEVSWFQKYPTTSIKIIDSLNLSKLSSIIDIGGGDSNLVDVLLERGFTDITVLDISSNAIEKTKMRLGEKAKLVKWIVCDITEFEPKQQYDLWHDRAAFHFLTTQEKIEKYIEVVNQSTLQDGNLIIATFSEEGPTKCSNLDVKQYSESTLTLTFAANFDKQNCRTINHVTPSLREQNFLFCTFKKIK